MNRRCRILACGSPDGGDDAAALDALQLLPPAVALRASLEDVRQLPAEQLLGDPPGSVRLVVDCVAGVGPGEVVDLPLRELPALERRLRPASSHALSIGQAVALADRLGGIGPGDRFIGIGGAAFGLGQPKSPAVEAGLPGLVARIEGLVP